MLFINSDDLLASPHAISSLVDARLRYAGTKSVVCYSDFIKHYPSLDRSLLLNANDACDKGFMLCHQAMLVDRSAYDHVGIFDTSFRYAADHDWTARAKRAGVEFMKADVPPTVIFRHGGASHASYRLSRAEGGRVILREYGRAAYFRYTVRQYWVRFLRELSDRLVRLIGTRALASLQGFYFRRIRRYHEFDPSKRQ